MNFNTMHICKHIRPAELSVFLLFLLGVPRDIEALSWVTFDKVAFNIAVQAAKYSISVGAKVVLNNPRIAVLALAIYFRKEILNLAKDTTGYVVGEYPYISLLMVLGSMAYYSFVSCDVQDKQEQENDDSDDLTCYRVNNTCCSIGSDNSKL